MRSGCRSGNSAPGSGRGTCCIMSTRTSTSPTWRRTWAIPTPPISAIRSEDSTVSSRARSFPDRETLPSTAAARRRCRQVPEGGKTLKAASPSATKRKKPANRPVIMTMRQSMSRSYFNDERNALDATARAIVEAHPRVIDLIARGARADPDGIALAYLRTALDDNPASIRYDTLMGLLHAAANWYRRHGIGPQDAVAILAPSCPATVVAMWAATAVGAANPLNLLFTR